MADTVDPEWETRRGHAHAAARYGAMSRPRPAAPADFGKPDNWEAEEGGAPAQVRRGTRKARAEALRVGVSGGVR